MVLGLALAAIAFGLRSGSRSRHVRGRLMGSACVFAVYAAVSAALLYGDALSSPELRRQVGQFSRRM
jgi:hypothetical protein